MSLAKGSGLRPFRPQRFGRFTLLAPLAAGGMGQIYLARARFAGGLEKLCVIKKVLPELARDPDFAGRFREEAQTLVQLQHGSIAQVYDSGEEAGEWWIALEFVDGKDLRRLLQRMRTGGSRVPLPIALYVAVKILEALAYAHRKKDGEGNELGLVHRDVSPQNVLLSYEGEVKVIDFGLARSTISEPERDPSVVMGKFHYMAPEQARNLPLDRRADLYAVGVILYEMITGWNPFEEASPVEVVEWAASPRIPPVQRLAPEVPDSVAAALAKALAIDPAERFGNAEELRGRLSACLSEVAPDAGPERLAALLAEVFAEEHERERAWMAALTRGEGGQSPAAEETTRAASVPRLVSQGARPQHAGTARFGEEQGEPQGQTRRFAPPARQPVSTGLTGSDEETRQWSEGEKRVGGGSDDPFTTGTTPLPGDTARTVLRPEGEAAGAGADTGRRAPAVQHEAETELVPWDRDRSGGAAALRSAAAAATSAPRGVPWYEAAAESGPGAVPAPERTPQAPFPARPVAQEIELPGIGSAAAVAEGPAAVPALQPGDETAPAPRKKRAAGWVAAGALLGIAGAASIFWPAEPAPVPPTPAPVSVAAPAVVAAPAPQPVEEAEPDPLPAPAPAAVPARVEAAPATVAPVAAARPATQPAPKPAAEVAAALPDRRTRLAAERRKVLRKYEELVRAHGADQVGAIVGGLVRATDSQFQRLIEDPQHHDALQQQLDELDRLLEERRRAFAP
ncbi:serine/threonine-protein kinase [Vulgatibacter sp.]|uniref:serine/threonine-protein kinase n=1 Tax=Vulgatibacter sp. TaxID=1971226 RepID=UPI003566B08C